MPVPSQGHIGVTGFVACFPKGTCDILLPKQTRYQAALHPVGTPGGSRTHNETDFKSATSSNWATGANFGTLGGNRTHNLPFLRRQPLPVGLQEQVWQPHQDSNLESSPSKGAMLPITPQGFIARAGFEPATSSFRAMRLPNSSTRQGNNRRVRILNSELVNTLPMKGWFGFQRNSY
jgi:hypothetical protein